MVSPYMPELRVEIAFDSGVATLASARTWTDVSAYLELENQINITRGRQDERSTVEPSSLSLTLDNRDGRFTPGNASSPYYPNVKLGRPIRVSASLLDTGDKGTFNTGVSDWVASNGTLASVSTPLATSDSTNAGRLTVTAGADATVTRGATTADGARVVPGATYLISGWVQRSTGTSKVANLRVLWYTAANSLITTDTVFSTTLTTTAYRFLSATATAPATAHHARIQLQIASATAGQIFFLDEFRLDSVRFTGYVDEWPVEWPDEVDATAYSPLVASSRLARLSEGAELRSIIETEITADDPIAYYPLGEPEGSLFAQEFTGSDPVGMYSYYGGGGIEFGTRVGPRTDDLPAVALYPRRTTQREVFLAANFRHSMSVCTVEVFVAISPQNDTNTVSFISLWQNLKGSGDYEVLQIDGVSFEDIAYVVTASVGKQSGGTFKSISSNEVYADPENALAKFEEMFNGRVHHLAATYDPGSPPEIKLYLDGDLFTTGTDITGTGPVSTSMPSWQYLLLGPLNTVTGDSPMSFAHAAVYDTILPDDRIKAHADAGLNGFAGEMASERITRYAEYAGIDDAEIVSDTGIMALTHIDTTDQTPDALMRTIEATESGVLYDDREGILRFRDRSHRYQTVNAFTLDAALQQVEAGGLRPVLDRSAMTNSVTARSSSGTNEQRYEDATAVGDYGPQRVDLEMATDDVDQLYQTAAWRVNRYKEPRPRVPGLAPVDILPLDAGLRAAIIGADISTRFTVTNLPSQAPAPDPDFFIEGITETIDLESWRFQFNVSPAEIFDDVWVLEDASKGQLGTTTTLAL